MRQNDTHLNGQKNAAKLPTTNDASKVKSNKRPNKCDLGPNFIAPDGGWAWLVLIAAGCSNVSRNFQTAYNNSIYLSINSMRLLKYYQSRAS